MSVEANKQIVRQYFEGVHSQRKTELIDEIFSAELAPPTRNVVALAQTAFPDYKIEINDQVAEGDKVATVWTLKGTHQGDWESPIGTIAPTGKYVSYTGSTMLRVVEGRIVEVIGTNHDHLGLLQQMGAVPDIARRSGA